MTFWQKKTSFLHKHPKNTIFLVFFFEIFFFHFFHVFSFSFSNIKKTKTKSAHFFFENSFFDTLTNSQKKYFRTPTHYLCFFKIPKKHYKTGEKQTKKILDQVLTQPWTKFWLKKPQILDQVLTLQHIYIYMYAVRLLSGPRFGVFNSY